MSERVMRDPKVTVIMPAYNASKYIRKAIDSVLSQTYQDWEMVIVDDCATDDTADIIMEYVRQDDRIRYLKNEKNSGVAITRYRAAEEARTNWLALLDADDAWTPDKLEKQLRAIQREKCDVCFAGSSFVDENDNPNDYILHVPPHVEYRNLLKQNVLSNSSAVVRRSLFLKHAVKRSDIHEDLTCWVNVLRGGGVAYGIDEPLLIYRVSKGSKSGNKLHSAHMTWKTYRAAGLNVVSTVYYMGFYMKNGTKKYSSINNGWRDGKDE